MTDKALAPPSSRDQGEIPVDVQLARLLAMPWNAALGITPLVQDVLRELATVKGEKDNQARIIAQFSDDLVAAEATILRLRTELDGLVKQCHELVQELGTLREDEEVIRGMAHRLEQTLAAFTVPRSGPTTD